MKALLLVLLALPAAAAGTTKPWLSDNPNATQNVNVLESALPAGAASEATQVAVSTTLTAIKTRADLLATEQSAVAISTTLAAIKARADLLASEATAVVISTTLTSLNGKTTIINTNDVRSSSTTAHVTAHTSVEASNRAGKLFSAVTEVTIAGSAENNIMLLVNLTTNTLTAHMENLTFNMNDNNAAATLRIYETPVVTSSGTAISIRRRQVGGSGSTQMQAFSAPTTSASGNKLLVAGSGKGAVYTADQHDAISIAPGTKLLFTSQPSGSGFTSSITAVWSEE